MRKFCLPTMLFMLSIALYAGEAVLYPSLTSQFHITMGSDVFQNPQASDSEGSQVPLISLMPWELGADFNFLLGMNLKDDGSLQLLAGPGGAVGFTRFRSEISIVDGADMPGLVSKIEWLSEDVMHYEAFFSVALGKNRKDRYDKYYLSAGTSLYTSIDHSDKQAIIPSFAIGLFNQPIYPDSPFGSGMGIELGLDWFSFTITEEDIADDITGSFKKGYTKQMPVISISVVFGMYSKWMPPY